MQYTFNANHPKPNNHVPSKFSKLALRKSVSLWSISGKSKWVFDCLGISIGWNCCICTLCFSKFEFNLSKFCWAKTRFCCWRIAAAICCWFGATDFGLSSSCWPILLSRFVCPVRSTAPNPEKIQVMHNICDLGVTKLIRN